jgi:hypothetical protein
MGWKEERGGGTMSGGGCDMEGEVIYTSHSTYSRGVEGVEERWRKGIQGGGEGVLVEELH